MVPQITGLMVHFSTVYSDADQRKYQSSASLVFVRGIHRWPVYDPQKKASNAEKFPFDDAIVIHSWFMNIVQWFQTKNDDQLFPTHPSDIFQAKSHRYGHYVLSVWWISDHAEYGN